MSTGYLDAFAGLSGDMVAGALLDCGADFAELERAAAGLGLGGYRLTLRRKDVSGIAAAKFKSRSLSASRSAILAKFGG
jgi:pyridinium-3,5-bisthiocarboxylic acid mononucleotide nickel chelatase